MRQLDLRTRMLMAFGIVAALQVVSAFALISTTRDHLVDQIDDRLAVVRPLNRGPGLNPPPPPADGERARPERLGETYEGRLTATDSLITFFAPNTTGSELPPPEINVAMAGESSALPLTVEAEGGDFRYRLTAVSSEDGDFFITAIPLDGVDSTMARLTGVVLFTIASISLALALIAWWVLRLGIAPIKRMTRTADAIADGDLSERISDVDQRTEAGQLGNALNTMLGQIETSFDERSRAEDKLRQFIADASHELRTPVATIRGYAELYRAGGLSDRAELDDAMRRTELESQRMSRLIADMLDLAKLDREPTLTTRPVDLAALARDTVADAQVTHPERTIAPTIAEQTLIINADEDRLRQALTNLVSNAIVHTSPDASVTVKVTRGELSAVLQVIDDGEGMSPAVVARTTERFYRADPSRSRHSGGSGLGLSIVDGVVNAHGGTLTIDSAPDRGTTATITLPLANF